MASRVAWSSPASFMRLKSSRQLRPASTRMCVRPPQTIVLLPLEPEASTVKRTIKSEYREPRDSPTSQKQGLNDRRKQVIVDAPRPHHFLPLASWGADFRPR